MSGQTTPDVRDRRADDGAETTLLLQLLRAARQIESGVSAELAALRITPEQWRIICVLTAGGGHTMTELATLAVLPAATCTRTVDRLVSSGTVYRRADPTDRRRVVVFLSARGRRSVAPITDAERTAQHEIARSLGPRGYVGLQDALRRIASEPTVG
ncbi:MULTISPECIES: MarR family winged helix-turn-helix transcriptional regulator [unclassified Gordonia (in: high G+C Gram-positive bacteria)]